MKPDIQLKKFFEHDDRFLSRFNAYFYHGESVLKEEYLSPDDSEVVKLVASNPIDEYLFKECCGLIFFVHFLIMNFLNFK